LKKLTIEQKKWQIDKCEKIMLRRSKLKKKRMPPISSVTIQQQNTSHKYKKNTEHKLYAPETLNLIENAEETLSFFKKVLDTVHNGSFFERLYFDLSKIENLSIDAIMYIIALISNVKKLKTFKMTCRGNLPQNKSARELIEKSGFYKFVTSTDAKHVPFTQNERIQISGGREADSVFAGAICDFVQEVSKKDCLFTKRLFPMLIEMMANTRQHAYTNNGNSIMYDKWYIFAEDSSSSVIFVFLDTGLGIPTTVRRNFPEKITEIFKKLVPGFPRNDAVYIASALRGEFRSETQKKHRGKGLPEIYNNSQNGTISNLTIFSGDGMCRVSGDGTITEKSFKTAFSGTLFSWKFNKQ
jgi:hypothetical protein